MKERDELGRFIKGVIPYCKLHPEIMPRGENHHLYGKTPSFKTRKKMSEAHLGVKIPKEVILKRMKTLPRGEKHHKWNGGMYKHNGYVYIRQTKHPYQQSRGYVKRGRLVVEKELKRYILREEQTHHINGIRDDDLPQNLILFSSNSAHKRFEQSGNIKQEEIIFDGRKL